MSLNRQESCCLITVIVLTLNEGRHLRRCIESLRGLAVRVVVVDSFSTDSTVALAAELGVEIFQHKFVNHANQFNWALDSVGVSTPWIMRLDADEVATTGLVTLLNSWFQADSDKVSGLTVNRQIHFMGKWIRRGGIYPIRTLRIWRNGQGRCENRWMDEHIVVTGEIAHLNADIADINLNNISWWTAKHNDYAGREAIELLLGEVSRGRNGLSGDVMSRKARLKRWVKHRVYARLPSGLRALMYFLYRYFLLFGFLDGWRGLVFHALQGLWYRFLVDVKVYELRMLMAERGLTLEQVVSAEYGYDISVKPE